MQSEDNRINIPEVYYGEDKNITGDDLSNPENWRKAQPMGFTSIPEIQNSDWRRNDFLDTEDKFILNAYEGGGYIVQDSWKKSGEGNLSLEETKKVAEKYADALSIIYWEDYTVNKDIEPNSFDLDVNGDEFDGGSFLIYGDGSVVNVAVTPSARLGSVSSSVNEIIDKVLDLMKQYKKAEKEDLINYEGRKYGEKLVTEIKYAGGGSPENENEVYIEFLNKEKNFTKDRKSFKTYEDAVKWARENFEKFNPDMIHYYSGGGSTKPNVTDKIKHNDLMNRSDYTAYVKINDYPYTATVRNLNSFKKYLNRKDEKFTPNVFGEITYISDNASDEWVYELNELIDNKKKEMKNKMENGGQLDSVSDMLPHSEPMGVIQPMNIMETVQPMYAGGGEIDMDVVKAIFDSNESGGQIQTSRGKKSLDGLYSMIGARDLDSETIAKSIFIMNSNNGKISTDWGDKTLKGLTSMIQGARESGGITYAGGGGVENKKGYSKMDSFINEDGKEIALYWHSAYDHDEMVISKNGDIWKRYLLPEDESTAKYFFNQMKNRSESKKSEEKRKEMLKSIFNALEEQIKYQDKTPAITIEQSIMLRDIMRNKYGFEVGGQLKPIPEGNKGLPKLPEEVRNRMGYMKNGGGVGKKRKKTTYKVRQLPKTIVERVELKDDEYNQFIKYVHRWCSDKTEKEVKQGVDKYIDALNRQSTWGGGDTLDRERAMEFVYNTRRKKLPKRYAGGGGVAEQKQLSRTILNDTVIKLIKKNGTNKMKYSEYELSTLDSYATQRDISDTMAQTIWGMAIENGFKGYMSKVLVVNSGTGKILNYVNNDFSKVDAVNPSKDENTIATLLNNREVIDIHSDSLKLLSHYDLGIIINKNNADTSNLKMVCSKLKSNNMLIFVAPTSILYGDNAVKNYINEKFDLIKSVCDESSNSCISVLKKL